MHTSPSLARRLTAAPALAVALALPLASSRAQSAGHVHQAAPADRAPAPAPVAAAYRVSIPLLARSPVIDGRIDPGEWSAATRVDGLTQMEPAPGEPMTERTEVLVARDAEHLYVAFVAHDGQMGRVRAELTRRDDFTASADAVGLAIDPYGTGSRGYHFLFTPLGAQSDAAGTGDPDFTWDGVLASRGAILADRYVVEVAIPFSTILTGGQPRGEWDINFFRQIPRKGEEGWWSPVPRGEQRHLFEHMGRLSGVADVASRTRFELIPTATAHARAGGASPVGGATETSWGATVRLPLSPMLRAEGTWRPDFSAVESDAAQVGFNERFALFYPEKRPFFLEGATRFETPGSSFVSDPLRLIHTRTLVRPELGARVLASPDGGFVGAMFVADEDADGRRAGTAAIVRAKLERPGGVQAGVLATRRDTPRGTNTVAAADAQLRLPARATLTLQLAGSEASADSLPAARRGTAAYVDLSRETGGDFEQVVYRRIDRTFETQLGYVPRTDLQQVVSHAGTYWRPATLAHGALIDVSPMMQYALTLDAAGRRVEAEYLPHVQLDFTRQTRVFLGYRFGDESYRGHAYAQGRAELRVSTTPAPWVSLAGAVKRGRRVRYDLDESSVDRTFVADYAEASATADLRPGRATALSVSGVRRRLGGRGDIEAREVWLGRVAVLYHATSAAYVRALAQYDPDGQARLASLLFGLELSYGTQLHVGTDYASTDAPLAATGARAASHSVFIRLSYLLRR